MSVKAVLVVDDGKRTRETLRMLLKLEGFVVDCCESGLAACERLQDMHFDFILTDFLMPETDGIEVTRLLRGLCPNAFISGMSIEDKGAEFASAGAEAFICKERLVQDLLPMVRQKVLRQ